MSCESSLLSWTHTTLRTDSERLFIREGASRALWNGDGVHLISQPHSFTWLASKRARIKILQAPRSAYANSLLFAIPLPSGPGLTLFAWWLTSCYDIPFWDNVGASLLCTFRLRSGYYALHNALEHGQNEEGAFWGYSATQAGEAPCHGTLSCRPIAISTCFL